ncbi:MAG: hypothetical protein DRP85_02570 [Candidatus Makaraimicrobium thalassicum]|nr:MAG: hypothetical protein DRP85_02570 [Candidatus Omnitrophota bacterium]
MGSLVTDSSAGIIYRQWTVPFPRAVLLLVHGLGAHTGRWGPLSGFFLSNRISSYAVALRGFGEAGGVKGHIDSFDVYFKDIRSLYEVAGKENPGVKIFLLGESMGALLCFVMACLAPDLAAGLICISPAFRNGLKFAAIDYLKMFLPLLYDPQKRFEMPFDAAMCTRDINMREKMDADAREHRLASSKLLFEIAAAQVRATFIKNRLKTGVLFLLPGRDKLVDPGASRKIFAGIGSGDKELIEYPDMYHALSIGLGREKVFNDILGWINKRAAKEG